MYITRDATFTTSGVAKTPPFLKNGTLDYMISTLAVQINILAYRLSISRDVQLSGQPQGIAPTTH